MLIKINIFRSKAFVELTLATSLTEKAFNTWSESPSLNSAMEI